MNAKYTFFTLLFATMLGACKNERPIVEPLTDEDVVKLIEKDTIYEDIITDVELVRDTFEKDIVLRSKYSDVTYNDIYEFQKKLQDTTLLKRIADEARAVYEHKMDSLLSIYKPKIDSLREHYQEIKEKRDPSKYLNVEFHSIKKNYSDNNNYLRSLTVKFRVTPLQGPIQGGSFYYKVKPKVTGHTAASGGSRFSSYTSQPTIYSWEADYDVEDEFEDKSTYSIKQNYDFEFAINTVRVKNETINAKDIEIPFMYEEYLNEDSLTMYQYSSILSIEYDMDEVHGFEHHDKVLKREKRKINSKVAELLELVEEIKSRKSKKSKKYY